MFWRRPAETCAEQPPRNVLVEVHSSVLPYMVVGAVVELSRCDRRHESGLSPLGTSFTSSFPLPLFASALPFSRFNVETCFQSCRARSTRLGRSYPEH